MKKLILMVLGVAATAAFAIQKPEVQVLTFTVTGAETYADGSALADGECFALVWSKDGKFEGVNVDGTAKREGDEVVYIGKIVKDNTVVFRIEDGFKTGGSFDIWILDTRVLENDTVKSIGKTGGKVVVSHAAKATVAAVQASGSQAIPTSVEGLPNGVVIAPPTIDPANIPDFKFTDIKVDGDWVVMEIDNTIPGVNYTSVDTAGEKGSVTSGNGGKITLIRPKQGDSAIIRGRAE